MIHHPTSCHFPSKWMPLAVAVFWSIATPLSAVVIAQDDFSEYTVGQAPNHAGGSGWAGVWSIGPKTKAVIEEAKGLDGEVKNCLRVSGGDSVRALIRRVAAFDKGKGEPIYLRVVFEIVPGSDPSATLFSSWSFRGDKMQESAKPAEVTMGNGSRASARIGNDKQSAQRSMDLSTVYTVVGKMGGWDDERKEYTTVSLWINPDLSASEDSQDQAAEATGSSGCSLFKLLFFRLYGLEGGAYRLFDVRITTDWIDLN